MNYNSIVYLWDFKPNQVKNIPMEFIQQNKQFISEHTIASPVDITSLLSSFDGLSELWAKIPEKYWIVKVDLGRLLYIYKHSGFYLDIDCKIKKNPFDIVNPQCDRMVLFTESVAPIDELGPRECKNPRNSLRVANFAFASNLKHHPFLETCIHECMRRLEHLFQLNLEQWEETDILWVCGPDVMTTAYHAQFDDDGSDVDADSSIRLIGQGYLQHWGYGSWRDNTVL